MQYSGKCDCGCGQHSIWTVVHTYRGRKLWFLTLDHLRRWQAVREVEEKQLFDALPFLADPWEPVSMADSLDN